jgi:hypothetical protein
MHTKLRKLVELSKLKNADEIVEDFLGQVRSGKLDAELAALGPDVSGK